MKGISMTGCILHGDNKKKKSRFKIKTMLNPLYKGAARRIQVTREERLALIVS